MATATHHRTGEALPRSLIAIGVPCAGVLLIALFLIRGFPYDKLGVLIANRIEQSHGIHLAVGDVGPALQLAGPALEGTQLRVTFPNRSPQQIDRALVRPAWSLSWLAGEPALPRGIGEPVWKRGRDAQLERHGASWVGTIRDARPELPPIADWIPTGGLEGKPSRRRLTFRWAETRSRGPRRIRDPRRFDLPLPGSFRPATVRKPHGCGEPRGGRLREAHFAEFRRPDHLWLGQRQDRPRRTVGTGADRLRVPAQRQTRAYPAPCATPALAIDSRGQLRARKNFRNGREAENSLDPAYSHPFRAITGTRRRM